MKKSICLILLGVFWIGCEKINQSEDQSANPNSPLTRLYIVTEPAPSRNSSFHLRGVSINQTTVTITNTGVVTVSEYIRVTSDTVYQDIALSAAEWYSSNSVVVQASQGVLAPQGPGSAYIWAKYQNTLSDSVFADVRLLKLFFVAKPDTLVMSTDASQGPSLQLQGIYITQRRVKVMNTEMLRVIIDTLYKDIVPSATEWYSSNSSVVFASQGVISSQAPGLGYVWAKYQNVVSDSVLVDVRAAEVAPDLFVDLPDASLIFRDTLIVSGSVQKYAQLRIDELTTGYAKTNIPYSPDGSFQETIPGLVAGLRIFSITAQNPTRSDLKTTKLKVVLYYSYGSLGADSITGQWTGECAGRPINFYVSKNQYLPRYDITGVVDIQFLNYGLIQGVDLVGAVNSDGTMDLSVSKSYQGFTISGSLNGLFHTTGKADGTISAKIEKSLLPSVSFSETWWAVKQ